MNDTPIPVSERLPDFTHIEYTNSATGTFIREAETDRVLAWCVIDSNGFWITAKFRTTFEKWIKNGDTMQRYYKDEWVSDSELDVDWEYSLPVPLFWLPMPGKPIVF